MSSDDKYSGTYSAKIVNTDPWQMAIVKENLWLDHGVILSTVNTRIYIKVTSAFSSSITPILFQSAGTPVAYLVIVLDGGQYWMYVRDLVGEADYGHSVVDFVANKYHCLELGLKTIGSDVYLNGYFDGVLKCSSPGLDLTAYPIDDVVVGSYYAGLVATMYIDDVVVSDSYIGTEVSNRLLTGVGLGCVSSP